MEQGRSGGRWPLVVVLLLLGVTGCSYPYFFWLAPGATAEALTFLHGYKDRGSDYGVPDHISVATCDLILPDQRRVKGVVKWGYWYESSRPDQGDRTITYGATPGGATTSNVPERLAPGCHTIEGGLPGHSGRSYFWILPDGSARDFTEAQRDSLYAVGERHARIQEAAHQRAKEACRQRYLAAGPDTATWAPIDPLVLSDTLRYSQIACKWFREHYPALTSSAPR